jgi:DNA polymerase III epsilon subunit-like protein
MKDLCFIDVETTGSVFGYHEIIEIAAIRTAPDASLVRGMWHERVRPRHPERITPVAQELNGFTVYDWLSAPESNQKLWNDFAQFAAGCIPVCHNPSFDRAFIMLAAGAEGVSDLGLDYHWIGTESLAWPLYCDGMIPKMSLSTLCQFLGLECESTVHRALGGAQACYSVYCALMTRWSLAAPAAIR